MNPLDLCYSMLCIQKMLGLPWKHWQLLFLGENISPKSLQFTWEWNPNLGKMSTQALAHWEVSPQLPRSESISLGLASLHFGSSGGKLAYCYVSIATEETLST